MSGGDRYIAQYLSRKDARGAEVEARPGHGRLLALTLAFTPMIAFAALPVTVVAVVIATIVRNVMSLWLGLVVLAVAVIALGFVTARWAVKHDDVPATRGWRRWLPLAATVVVVAECLAEIASGGRTPDPVILLWVASFVWVVAFVPLANVEWGPARRALWAVAPALMFATVVFVWTHGFFWLRFERAVPDLDALAQQIANGDRVPNGTQAGGFEVQRISRGPVRGNMGCDMAFWITGWHDDDTRYIAHCVGHPKGSFAHLAGDWWQLEDKQRPSDL